MKKFETPDGDSLRMRREASRLLQWAAEGHASEHLARANHLAAHAKRVTVDTKDLECLQYLQKALQRLGS